MEIYLSSERDVRRRRGGTKKRSTYIRERQQRNEEKRRRDTQKKGILRSGTQTTNKPFFFVQLAPGWTRPSLLQTRPFRLDPNLIWPVWFIRLDQAFLISATNDCTKYIWVYDLLHQDSHKTQLFHYTISDHLTEII